MNNIETIQSKIDETYVEIFGETPLNERLQDILGEAIELSRFVDIKNLREECGDLLGSTMQLANECGFNVKDLIDENISKIKRRKNQYKSLGRKKIIGILGGAFNPPTLAHIAVAKYVLDTSRLFDEIHLMPCFDHMYGKDMAPAEDRLEMCKIAAQVDGRIKVSDYEIKNELSGETYYLARRLFNDSEITDRYDCSFIIGLDNALTFDKWVNYDHLERMARFIVVPRDGVEDDPKVDWFRKPPHIWIPFDNDGKGIMPGLQVSSTKVRDWFRIKGKDQFIPTPGSKVDDYLDEDVQEYILTKGFYRGE